LPLLKKISHFLTAIKSDELVKSLILLAPQAILGFMTRLAKLQELGLKPSNLAIRWSQHKNEKDPIRVFSITDLQLSSFTDIIIRHRIFKWFRPGNR